MTAANVKEAAVLGLAEGLALQCSDINTQI